MENPIKMDDLGVPVFFEKTPIYFGVKKNKPSETPFIFGHGISGGGLGYPCKTPFRRGPILISWEF